MLIFDCDGVLLDSEIIADRVVLEHLQNLLNSHGDKSLFSEQGSLREWLTDSSGQDDAGILKKFYMFTNIPLPTDSLKQLERNLKHALSKEVRAIKGMGELLKSIKGMWVVASNSSLSRLRISLGRAEMLDLCRSRLFSSEMVKRFSAVPLFFWADNYPCQTNVRLRCFATNSCFFPHPCRKPADGSLVCILSQE